MLDLDDSQPDNGAHSAGDGDGDITESDSEVSIKDDIDEEPVETKYIPNKEEEFGNVCCFFSYLEQIVYVKLI